MIRNLLNNQFFKVFTYNGIIVLGKIITSFVVSKVSAIYLGPSGYALVGNFKNILQGVLGLTSTGFESGVIKYISENKSDDLKLKVVVVNVFTLNLIICLLIAPFLFFFSERLAIYAIKDLSFSYIFKYLALLLPLISFSFLIIYIVKGLQRFKLYTILVSVTNVLNALLTFIFIYFYNIEGALVASMVVPILSFIAAFLFRDIRILFVEAIRNFESISVQFFKVISTYLLMAIYSSVLISLSYLFIRNAIISSIDIRSAGLWEAMNKISMFYMIFFSSLMTLYLLPKLAENKTVNGYKKIMKTYFKSLIPFAIISFVILFFLRVIVIRLFLTKEFLEVSQYFYLQLIGDFIKIVAFSLAYQFHAKKMVLAYFVTDAILYGSFYFLSIYFLNTFDFKGVFLAYLLSVILYFIFVLFFIYKLRYRYLVSENV